VTRQPTSSKIQSRFHLLLGAFGVFAAVTVTLLAWLSETGGSNLSDAEAQDLLEGILQSGTTLGEDGALAKIRIYEDFQCPACAQFICESFPDLVTRHVKPGEVKLVSETLAVLGRCWSLR
jgi:hypothetical protein